MKTNGLFFILISLLLAACQPQRETIREVIIKPETTLPTQNPQGGGDPSGGGNCVYENESCFTIEYFRKPARESLAYKNFIIEIINNLTPNFPELAADLIHISQERSWYWVPVALEKLPNRKIGTYFGVEQYAMQGLKEVYFDRSMYEKMPDKAQALALLHELVMGIQLMEYQSELDKCFAVAVRKQFETPGDDTKYREARAQCYKENSDPNWSPSSGGPGESDYPNIRKLTNELFNHAGKIDAEEWKHWMKANRIRNY